MNKKRLFTILEGKDGGRLAYTAKEISLKHKEEIVRILIDLCKLTPITNEHQKEAAHKIVKIFMSDSDYNLDDIATNVCEFMVSHLTLLIHNIHLSSRNSRDIELDEVGIIVNAVIETLFVLYQALCGSVLEFSKES